MNISCISCPARYGVPDAKLAGKRVRITCKRCGAVLLVDGSVNPPRVSSGANVGPSVAPVARTSLAPDPAPAPKAAVEFMVVMADDRQESADVAQIVRLYRDRQINAETLVWRDGMADWKAIWEVEEIAAAFRRMGYARPSQPTPRPSQPAQTNYDDGDDASTHVAPSSHPPPGEFDDDEATSVVDSSRIPFDIPLAGYSRSEDDDPTGIVPSPMELALAAPAPVLEPIPLRNERSKARGATLTRRTAQAAVEPTPSPPPAALQRETRARAQTRNEPRARAQGLDIFAEQQRAAEQELAAAIEDDGARLTGARGENSVLFSLDQLVKQEAQKQRPVVIPQRARTDESVLVDSSPSLPSGVVGSALIAPDFTAPVSAPPPRVAEPIGDFDYPEKKKGGWLWPVVAIVFLGALAGGWFSGKLQPLLAAAGLPVGVTAEASAAPSASAAPTEKPTADEAASAAPGASAAPEASASASAATSAAPSAAPVAAAGTPRPSTPREPAAAAAPADTAPAPKESATKPAASGGGDFDTAAAKTALTAAANNAGSCKEAAGPTGSGKVSITFAPSGRPTSVAVTGELAGTTVGSCVAKLFRAARVPPFSGEAVSVSKAFSVQ